MSLLDCLVTEYESFGLYNYIAETSGLTAAKYGMQAPGPVCAVGSALAPSMSHRAPTVGSCGENGHLGSMAVSRAHEALE
ncbi:hypothetical protein HAX54_038414, partial [Datura stramonium]|nr:hypothetical protein [Datura stramonium]